MDYTNIDLRTLIAHSEWVEADQRLVQVYNKLSDRQVEYIAVLANGHLLGLCSRAEIGIAAGASIRSFPVCPPSNSQTLDKFTSTGIC